MNINWNNLNSLSKTGLSTRLKFGQYSGETIKDVVEFDAKYIIYLYEYNRIEPDNELLNLIHKTIKQMEENNESRKFPFDWEN